jgi:hypothetical protein
MFGWHDPTVRMPPVGLLVRGKLRNYTFRDIVKADLVHVDEDDCSWRTADGYEVSYGYDVIRWRYKACWLVLFLMWLGLLPGHHSQDSRLRTSEVEVWLTEEAARQRRNKILARKNLRVEQKGEGEAKEAAAEVQPKA